MATPKPQKYLRGSNRVERVYAAVKLLMRARLSQAKACKVVAKILGPRLGDTKRGRPPKSGRRRMGQEHETVRAIYNSFDKRNPTPPSQTSAEFVDARTECWFLVASGILAWRRGRAEILPDCWRPCATAQVRRPDGWVYLLPFRSESLPSKKVLQAEAKKIYALTANSNSRLAVQSLRLPRCELSDGLPQDPQSLVQPRGGDAQRSRDRGEKKNQKASRG